MGPSEQFVPIIVVRCASTTFRTRASTQTIILLLRLSSLLARGSVEMVSGTPFIYLDSLVTKLVTPTEESFFDESERKLYLQKCFHDGDDPTLFCMSVPLGDPHRRINNTLICLKRRLFLFYFNLLPILTSHFSHPIGCTENHVYHGASAAAESNHDRLRHKIFRYQSTVIHPTDALVSLKKR